MSPYRCQGVSETKPYRRNQRVDIGKGQHSKHRDIPYSTAQGDVAPTAYLILKKNANSFNIMMVNDKAIVVISE